MREFFSGGLWMDISGPGFRVSTDSMVLSAFCRLRHGAAVCDLGCGVGTLGMLLLRDDPSLFITGVELLPDSAVQARKNIDANQLSDHFSLVTGDLRQHRSLLGANRFDAVVSNPPYFPISGTHPEASPRAIARSEICCTLDDLCAAAGWCLRFGGDFFLVHKPERLTDLLCTLRAHRLEPKRLRLVRHDPASGVSLILLHARLGAKPGLQFEPELLLFTADGIASSEYRAIYHQQED